MAIQYGDRPETAEQPCFLVTEEEMCHAYFTIHSFLTDIKNKQQEQARIKGKATHKQKVKIPTTLAVDILYCATYGFRKKNMYSNLSLRYVFWKDAPISFEDRLLSLLGTSFKRFVAEGKGEVTRNRTSVGKAVDSILGEIEEKRASVPSTTEIVESMREDKWKDRDAEIGPRMQKYITDFDLHSPIDDDMLRNLVITQILIEREHDSLLRGGTESADLKSLSEQVKNYVTLLGLSKKDRLDIGSERQKGSIAELATLYEHTRETYPEMEKQFLMEELGMLLEKHDRITTENERELDARSFKVVSGGFTIEEARELLRKANNSDSREKGSTSNT